ncbi:hypothetical protein N7471_010490 [Penicillium samsonianum]|uniref:uncharacterized protein n=1 Tax=Penicillium samsonianum TaxID=1882272 RepID=UPI0025469D89|nr:uncharacterized protein N7471_010490 [Penicillium samsonianum]KAJ6125997.1 hypothetical protein N7471_010490 [Penicillium samsonianum]
MQEVAMQEAYDAGGLRCGRPTMREAYDAGGLRCGKLEMWNAHHAERMQRPGALCRSNKNRNLRCSVPDDDLDLSGPFLAIDEPCSLTT